MRFHITLLFRLFPTFTFYMTKTFRNIRPKVPISLTGRSLFVTTTILYGFGCYFPATEFVRTFGLTLEKALESQGAKPSNRDSDSNRAKQHVHNCCFVRATPFYGFHPQERLFIKIVLYGLSILRLQTSLKP